MPDADAPKINKGLDGVYVSESRNNAQTLHFGDIETNYTIEKARKVKHSAEVLLKYINSLP